VGGWACRNPKKDLPGPKTPASASRHSPSLHSVAIESSRSRRGIAFALLRKPDDRAGERRRSWIGMAG
jgi:hypothetical protein